MGGVPVLVTKFQLASGQGHFLLSLESPGGEFGEKQVQDVEVARVAFTPELLRELVRVCGSALASLDRAAPRELRDFAEPDLEAPAGRKPAKQH